MSALVPMAPTLVCFAVPQEAKPFQKLLPPQSRVEVLLTGIGPANAERTIQRALREAKPCCVFTCGFAGALNSSLAVGDVVFGKSVSPQMAQQLQAAGAKQASFISTDRVVITSAEKLALYREKAADAVEMESAVIERICRESGIECVVLRAISDGACEDLPLDFNALMTADQKLDSMKLAKAIWRRPQKIPALMRLGKNSAQAAEKLAQTLLKVI